LIGHSEGGIIAPLAAVRTPEIAFIVLMAGPGVPRDELLQTQAAEIARANGLNEESVSLFSRFQSRAFDILKSQPDDQLAENMLRELLDEAIKKFTVEERKQLGLTDAENTGLIKLMLTPWFRNMLGYAPNSTLVKVRCPVLAINGEKDLQVSSKENLAGIAAALKAGGNHDFQTVELPGLNHLFQTCKTGLPAEYGEIEETISPSALKLMADWIRQRTNLDI
jgi:pimeloyl-ACP methyl ester carboxylesterase